MDEIIANEVLYSGIFMYLSQVGRFGVNNHGNNSVKDFGIK